MLDLMKHKMEGVKNMKKNNNTDFNINNVGERVTLYGWVAKVRNLGGVIFKGNICLRIILEVFSSI